MRRTVFASLWLASLAAAQSPQIGSCPVLPADNIWNLAIDQLPVSPSSSTYLNTIGASTGVHADFGSGLWDGGPIGIPFITVVGSQTKYPATFTYAGESDTGPYAVPLAAPIEGGSQSTGDRHAIAIDTDNCILYELYAAYPQSSSWKAGSGAIYNLRSNALRPATWTSADAAGLPIFPGLVRYDEILTGEIRHALRITVPQTLKSYTWPARHYASSLTDPKYPPMGARFRLRASFDVSKYSATNQIILRALKKYGAMIADNGSAWYLSGAPDSRWNNDDLHALGAIKGSDFEAVDVASLMVDPNSGQARQTTVSVSVSPVSASVTVNATKQFSATVQNSSNPGVTWSVNGVVGGNAVTGWINPAGLYTAPASPTNVTVQAASVAVPAAVGTSAVTVTSAAPPPPPPPPPPLVSVTVSPSSVTLKTGATQRFTASVKNSTNQSVTWKVNGVTGGNSSVGTISTTGLYRAPSSIASRLNVTIKATSVAAPTAAASATVTVRRR